LPPQRDGVSDVGAQVGAIGARLEQVNVAREAGLAAARAVIRASASAIRAVHRLDPGAAAARMGEAAAALDAARQAVSRHPVLAHAGFLHDAAKEYVEARATAAFVAGEPVPTPEELLVDDPAWLHGVAEAASELRRHALDRLRDGDLARAEALLARMDEVFGELVALDLPDAITSGLRRALDALRAVIERTRGDVTAAVLQQRLRVALEGRLT
jgi:translin